MTLMLFPKFFNRFKKKFLIQIIEFRYKSKFCII